MTDLHLRIPVHAAAELTGSWAAMERTVLDTTGLEARQYRDGRRIAGLSLRQDGSLCALQASLTRTWQSEYAPFILAQRRDWVVVTDFGVLVLTGDEYARLVSAAQEPAR